MRPTNRVRFVTTVILLFLMIRFEIPFVVGRENDDSSSVNHKNHKDWYSCCVPPSPFVLLDGMMMMMMMKEEEEEDDHDNDNDKKNKEISDTTMTSIQHTIKCNTNINIPTTDTIPNKPSSSLSSSSSTSTHIPTDEQPPVTVVTMIQGTHDQYHHQQQQQQQPQQPQHHKQQLQQDEEGEEDELVAGARLVSKGIFVTSKVCGWMAKGIRVSGDTTAGLLGSTLRLMGTTVKTMGTSITTVSTLLNGGREKEEEEEETNYDHNYNRDDDRDDDPSSSRRHDPEQYRHHHHYHHYQQQPLLQYNYYNLHHHHNHHHRNHPPTLSDPLFPTIQQSTEQQEDRKQEEGEELKSSQTGQEKQSQAPNQKQPRPELDVTSKYAILQQFYHLLHNYHHHDDDEEEVDTIPSTSSHHPFHELLTHRTKRKKKKRRSTKQVFIKSLRLVGTVVNQIGETIVSTGAATEMYTSATASLLEDSIRIVQDVTYSLGMGLTPGTMTSSSSSRKRRPTRRIRLRRIQQWLSPSSTKSKNIRDDATNRNGRNLEGSILSFATSQQLNRNGDHVMEESNKETVLWNVSMDDSWLTMVQKWSTWVTMHLTQWSNFLFQETEGESSLGYDILLLLSVCWIASLVLLLFFRPSKSSLNRHPQQQHLPVSRIAVEQLSTLPLEQEKQPTILQERSQSVPRIIHATTNPWYHHDLQKGGWIRKCASFSEFGSNDGDSGMQATIPTIPLMAHHHRRRTTEEATDSHPLAPSSTLDTLSFTTQNSIQSCNNTIGTALSILRQCFWFIARIPLWMLSGILVLLFHRITMLFVVYGLAWLYLTRSSQLKAMSIQRSVPTNFFFLYLSLFFFQ